MDSKEQDSDQDRWKRDKRKINSKQNVYINEKKWNKPKIKPERNEDTEDIWRNGERK